MMIKLGKLVRPTIYAMAIILVAPLSAAAQSATYENTIEPERTPKINLGKTTYDYYCASCHGEIARGTDKGPTFISRVYHPGHHGDQAFILVPKNGAKAHHWSFGDMKPIQGINDDQLLSILEYVRAVQKVNGLF